MRKTARFVGANLLDLLCPRSCLGCADLIESEEPCRFLCSSCVAQIQWVQFPFCKKCGLPFFGDLVAVRECPNCVALSPSFDEGRAAFLLSGIGQSLVHALKYRGVSKVLDDLPCLLEGSPSFSAFLEDAVLVPVPLHTRRFRMRGYNQAALIARALAKIVSGAQYEELLVRSKSTPTQTDLPRGRRLKNVKNAFAPKAEAVMDVRRRYVIIDDVITTGATLEACSRVLRKAGAIRVDVAALGHG